MKHKAPLLATAYIIIGLLTWGYKYNRIPPKYPTEPMTERQSYWYDNDREEAFMLAFVSGVLWPIHYAIEAALWATKPR